jgi:hypothetical protein
LWPIGRAPWKVTNKPTKFRLTKQKFKTTVD